MDRINGNQKTTEIMKTTCGYRFYYLLLTSNIQFIREIERQIKRQISTRTEQIISRFIRAFFFFISDAGYYFCSTAVNMKILYVNYKAIINLWIIHTIFEMRKKVFYFFFVFPLSCSARSFFTFTLSLFLFDSISIWTQFFFLYISISRWLYLVMRVVMWTCVKLLKILWWYHAGGPCLK